MRAIVVSTGLMEPMGREAEERASCLMPLLDRPFVQHVIEHVAGLGVTDIQVIICPQPEDIEAVLGDGTRWGVGIQYHLARNPDRPYERLPAALLNHEGPVLLAHADRLPIWEPKADRVNREGEWLVRQAGAEDAFSGWAVLSVETLRQVDGEWTENELADMLTARIQQHQSVDHMLSCSDYRLLSQAHWKVLQNHGCDLLLTGQEVEPGVWISRNVSLHPTARVTPPVWLGADCRVEQGVNLGPNAVVMAGSILDKRSSVRDSIIFPLSYVGQDLELAQAIVDRSRLVNPELGVSTWIDDAFILGSMAGKPVQRLLAGFVERLLAALIFILGLPCLALSLFWLWANRRRPRLLHSSEMVKLPLHGGQGRLVQYQLYSLTDKPTRGLDDLFLRFLPGLVNVMKGDLSLVGLAALPAAQLNQMPVERLRLYHRGKAGLVEEAAVVFGPKGGNDDLYVAESFYLAKAGLLYDVRLLGGYLLACLNKRYGRPAG